MRKRYYFISLQKCERIHKLSQSNNISFLYHFLHKNIILEKSCEM